MPMKKRKWSEEGKMKRKKIHIELIQQYQPFYNLVPLEICPRMTVVVQFSKCWHTHCTATTTQRKKAIERHQVTHSLCDPRISMLYLYKIIWVLLFFSIQHCWSREAALTNPCSSPFESRFAFVAFRVWPPYIVQIPTEQSINSKASCQRNGTIHGMDSRLVFAWKQTAICIQNKCKMKTMLTINVKQIFDNTT